MARLKCVVSSHNHAVCYMNGQRFPHISRDDGLLQYLYMYFGYEIEHEEEGGGGETPARNRRKQTLIVLVMRAYVWG